MIAGTKDEKAGKAAIGAISTRTERLVTGYLDALSAGLRGRSKPSLVVPKALPWRRKWVTRSSVQTLSTEPMHQPTRRPSRASMSSIAR